MVMVRKRKMCAKQNRRTCWLSGTKLLSHCSRTKVLTSSYTQRILVFIASSAWVESLPSVTSDGHLSEIFLRPWFAPHLCSDAVMKLLAGLRMGKHCKE